ncbi:MAG: adenylyl-sulfate kinase [Thiotrichaceae bacterium]
MTNSGCTILFTGLSGSGKSTLSQLVATHLRDHCNRSVTLLDGDIVRRKLSSELGFSKQHREMNLQRIGYIASEITKHGGITVCAVIAPYKNSRRDFRRLIEVDGVFIEIYVSTPIDVCENRDSKGMYAKARKGIITEFTGISDPYELPENPELTIDTSTLMPDEAANIVISYLCDKLLDRHD